MYTQFAIIEDAIPWPFSTIVDCIFWRPRRGATSRESCNDCFKVFKVCDLFLVPEARARLRFPEVMPDNGSIVAQADPRLAGSQQRSPVRATGTFRTA